MHHIAVDYVHKFSLSDSLPVCTPLHSAAPISDTALTLTVYTVPASSRIRIVELAGGDPEMTVSLPHTVVPLLLYCTWYWEMARSLWGGVQATIKAGIPKPSVLVEEMPVTLEGTVWEVFDNKNSSNSYIQLVSSIQRHKRHMQYDTTLCNTLLKD